MPTAKKYNEFVPGTFDSTKIFLQADAVTGALESIPMPTINDLIYAVGNLTIEMNGYAHQIVNASSFYHEIANAGATCNLYMNNTNFSFSVGPDSGNHQSYFSGRASGTTNMAEIVTIDRVTHVESRLKQSGNTNLLHLYNTVSSYGAFIEQAIGLIQLIVTDASGVSKLSLSAGVFNINLNGIGLPEYADTAAAIAAGLDNGDIFRTGEFVKIVIV